MVVEHSAKKMRINERWAYMGEYEANHDAWKSNGEWFVVEAYRRAAGPFREDQILRAVRVANAGVIDGCELVGSKPGFLELAPFLLPTRDDWEEVSTADLPMSITVYSADDAAPCQGCCTVFDAWPRISQVRLKDLTPSERAAIADSPLVGRLRKGWNMHPSGSLIGYSYAIETGFVILDSAQ